MNTEQFENPIDIQTAPVADDTEGHRVLARAAEDGDTQGNPFVARATEDEDTEAHRHVR